MANDGTVKIGTELDDSGFKSGLSNLGGFAKSAISGITAGVGAASVAVGVLGKKSLDAYASYEQLVGGVETLFKESSGIVQEYAENAYKTAGMSANAYMETVTNFSASLLQSYAGDTRAAAEQADMAITDMSDNANKMGTSIEMIKNAYQGFAKQNYTMLDNLKLGYGGTQQEMYRLMQDAEALGAVFNSEYSLDAKGHLEADFADIITAIHVVQEEMGIMGTTALEASTTIEGSLNTAKASWENLITGIADDNADLDTLISNFVESVSIAADNILPRIAQILNGAGSLIQQIAPIIAEQLPILIETVLPSLVSAGAQLIVGLISGIISALPALAESAPEIVMALVAALNESGPSMLEAGIQLLTMLGDGILKYVPKLIARLPDVIIAIVDFLTDNFPKILEKGAEFLEEFATGIIDAIPDLVAKLPEVIKAIVNFVVNNFPEIVKTGVFLLGQLAVGIIKAIPDLVKVLPQVIMAIVEGFGDLMGGLVEVGKDMVRGLWDGINSMVSWIKSKVSNFVGGIVDGVKGVLGIHSPSTVMRDQVGKNIGLGVAEGIEDSAADAQSAANQMAKDLAKAIPSVTMGVQYANAGMIPTSLTPSMEYAYASAPAGADASVLTELRAIKTAIAEGKIIMVDKQVLGRVAAGAIRNNERALGV